MAEEKKPTTAHAAGHGEKEAAGAGFSNLSFKGVGKFTFWFSMIFFVVAFTVLIAFINPTTAQNFIYFLQALQVFFGLVIIFCIYKLQDFRKRFLATCHEIDHLFAEKNGQGHGHGHTGHQGEHEKPGGHLTDESQKFLDKIPENILEERFQRAMKSVVSAHKEEWRVGLIELDKLLKDLLSKKDYEGETMEELLQDAKNRKFTEIENAMVANRTKKFLIKNMAQLPEEKDHSVYKNVATLYKLAINALMH